MTEIDPAQFRLRAFEQDWVLPLLDEVDGLVETDSARRLDLALLLEARLWRSLGVRTGYFAGAPEIDLDAPLGDLGEFAEIVEAAEYTRSWIQRADRFGDLLAQALDDLTPERRELLRIVYFAEEEEWQRRIVEVRRLAHAVAERPSSSMPPGWVDRVAWAIEGPWTENRALLAYSYSARLPSYWRSSHGIAEGRHATARRRWVDLREPRTAIANAFAPVPRAETTPDRPSRFVVEQEPVSPSAEEEPGPYFE